MKPKNEPWQAWLAEWQPPKTLNQHNHPADCRCCGVYRARARVALVLAALDVPLDRLTPAALKKAFLRCGVSPSYLDVLCATRKFLRWCQTRGRIPSSVVFEGRRTPASAQRVLEVPPKCPWLMDDLAAWKPPMKWHENFRKSVGLALRQIDPSNITAAALREAVAALSYSPGYSANVLFVLRQFLRGRQAAGKLPREALLTIDQPSAPIKLPAGLEKEIAAIITSAKGLRTKRPWRIKVREVILSEVRRFIAWNLAKGERIRGTRDLGRRHFDWYQDYLLESVTPRSGGALKKATVRNRMMYLLMFWRQAVHQDDHGKIDGDALKKFQLIAKTTPGTRPPLPDEIMQTLLRFDEDAFKEMSPIRQFLYFRRKAMIAVQESLWSRTEEIPRLVEENIHFDKTTTEGLVPVDIVNAKSRPQGFRETTHLFPPAAAMLKRWLAFRDKFFADRSITIKPLMERKFASPRERLGTPIFPSIKGEAIAPQAYGKIVANALHAASPGAHRRYSAYGIRHYGPKTAEEKGVPLKPIADRLRNNPLTAAQYYLAPEKSEDSAHAIWDRLTSRERRQRPMEAMTAPVAPGRPSGEVDVVSVSEAARLLGVDIHRLYRAIPTKLTPHELVLPSGRRGTGVRLTEAREWANSLTKGELSDLLFGERKPSNVYKLDLPLPLKRYGGQERVDASQAARFAIERQRLRKRGTLRMASRAGKTSPEPSNVPQLWQLSCQSPAVSSPSLS